MNTSLSNRDKYQGEMPKDREVQKVSRLHHENWTMARTGKYAYQGERKLNIREFIIKQMIKMAYILNGILYSFIHNVMAYVY